MWSSAASRFDLSLVTSASTILGGGGLEAGDGAGGHQADGETLQGADQDFVGGEGGIDGGVEADAAANAQVLEAQVTEEHEDFGDVCTGTICGQDIDPADGESVESCALGSVGFIGMIAVSVEAAQVLLE